MAWYGVIVQQDYFLLTMYIYFLAFPPLFLKCLNMLRAGKAELKPSLQGFYSIFPWLDRKAKMPVLDKETSRDRDSQVWKHFLHIVPHLHSALSLSAVLKLAKWISAPRTASASLILTGRQGQKWYQDTQILCLYTNLRYLNFWVYTFYFTYDSATCQRQIFYFYSTAFHWQL